MNAAKPQLLASVMAAALLGACSSDVSRFNDDPFQNPFNSRTSFDPVSTNSINRNRAAAPAPKPLQPMPQSTVSSQPLPPPVSTGRVQGLNPNANLTTGSVKSGVASANYPALVAEPRSSLGSVAGNASGWSAIGGTPVTLREGESINTLSQRYSVPVSAIMAVNGLSSVQQAQPGQQIMIPAYNAVSGSNNASRTATSQPGASAVINRPAQPMPVATARSVSALPPTPPRNVAPVKVAAGPAARNVAPQPVSDAEKRAAQKLREIKNGKSEAETKADAAKKKAEAAKAELKLAEKKKAEAAKLAAAKKAKEEAEAVKAAKLAVAKKKAADDNITTSSISEPKTDIKSNAFAAQPMPQAEVKQPESGGDQFRWPAKGRVISGFGARGTGGANDGINIALPEGTPVRAADGGTVVHADDALKGYGKLVLIRHPNGYVSVYAHNGELNVKRGESVKRGQVIAKSGASGNVTAPQLHFEIRKGSTPVDPTKHLGE